MSKGISGFLLLACNLYSQLIPNGKPIPKTSKPPVVFINGFQNICVGTSFSGTFGIADQILQSNGEASVFFDTCNQPLTASIEDLGNALGTFLSALRYEDGQPVPAVDVYAHSMGGLVLRSYLSGKQNASGVFQPPEAITVRKAIFLATPHFGSGIGLLFGFNTQSQELASGSRFLFDLGTWNQGTDDLRGIDAIAVAGNGGTGSAVMKGFDDGVVALTAASLRFYQPGRTRVLPLCHVGGGGLVSFAGLCSSDAKGVAKLAAGTDDVARLAVSFFNGTDEWKNIGVAAENDPFLSVDGGLDVTARTADDAGLLATSATATASTGVTKQLNTPSADVAYTDLFPAGSVTLAVGAVHNSVTLPAGGTEPFVVKDGPKVARVLPAAASVFPLTLAPGMYVAIYGTLLAPNTEVLLNGTPVQVFYTSPSQVNAVLPESAVGLEKLTVRTPQGSHTVNVLFEPAVPTLFTLDGSGTGSAAAYFTSGIVTLYGTGLGATANRGGLLYAVQQPTVTVGRQDCAVQYAGRAPGYPGVDQINCVLPAGIVPNAAVPVVVTSGSRLSNAATLTIP